MLLLEGEVNVTYQIRSIDLPEDSQRHLANLGLKVGTPVRLISKTATSAILMLSSSRLAFDQSILHHVDVERLEDVVEKLPLSELKVGEFAYIDGIFAVKEAKRRLMDMGLTRHTKVYLRKVAPLGDPIEISIRGYELTLRKSEAQLISVIRATGEER